MTRLICVLLTLLFSLSGPAMGNFGDFARSSIAAKGGNPAGKLIYDSANRTWSSPGGLVYGQGSAQGNRVLHVLDHTVPNPTKPVHSVFDVPRNQVIGLIDEAFASRTGPGVLQNNGNRSWIIDLGRQTGTGGQTGVQIIVRDGTSEIITAYPK